MAMVAPVAMRRAGCELMRTPLVGVRRLAARRSRGQWVFGPGPSRARAATARVGRLLLMRRLRHDPVAQFAVAGLVAMILIGLATAAVSRHTGTSEAIRDAKELTAFAGHGVVELNLTRGVIAGNPRALRRFDALV